MAISSEGLREKGAQLAARMVEWLEREGLARRLLDSYCAKLTEPNQQPKPGCDSLRLSVLAREALLVMAGFFLIRCSLQFRTKHLWFFRRPDWEALGAVWEGFAGVLGAHLDEEQKEFLSSLEISWPQAGLPTAPLHVQFAGRLSRALDPQRPEQAGHAAEKSLPFLERAVNDLTDQIFGP